MKISTYLQLATAKSAQGGLLVIDSDEAMRNIRVELPVKAPGRGTQLKAWLSNLPLLGSRASLQHARAKVENYSIQAGNQRISSLACLNGFVRDLHAVYGAAVADLCLSHGGIGEAKPLTARQVSDVIETANGLRENYQIANAKKVKDDLSAGPLCNFLESDVTFRKGSMIGLCDSIVKESSRALDWKLRVGEPAAKMISEYITGRCAAMPAYSQGFLTNSAFAVVATEALTIYEQVRTRSDIATPEGRLLALESALSRSSGEVDPEFHAAMAEKWAEPITPEALVALPGGTLIGKAFYDGVMGGACILNAQLMGAEPIKIGGWGNIPQAERQEKLEAEYTKLVSFFDGDAEMAQRFTLMPQLLFPAALQSVASEHMPLRLLDGRAVFPSGASEASVEISLRADEWGGSLSLGLAYHGNGFNRADCEGRSFRLDRSSTLDYAFDATFANKGKSLLLGQVRYDATLKESPLHPEYPEPTLDALRNPNNPAHDDMLWFANIRKDEAAVRDIKMLGVLNDFQKNPSLDLADTLSARFGNDGTPKQKQLIDRLDGEFMRHFAPLLDEFERLADQLDFPSSQKNSKMRLVFRHDVDALAESPSLSRLLALYRDYISDKQSINHLSLDAQQLDALGKAYEAAVAPVSPAVIGLIGEIKEEIVTRLGANFLPGFVSAMKDEV